MTRLESHEVVIKQSPQKVFEFLSDFNNYQSLMPDQVTDWKSSNEACSFTIKGMASLGMAIDSTTPNSEIKIRKDGKAPFDFFLTGKIGESDNPETSKLQLIFDADLNPFLKMVAEKPLTNFLNMLVDKYAEIHNG